MVTGLARHWVSSIEPPRLAAPPEVVCGCFSAGVIPSPGLEGGLLAPLPASSFAGGPHLRLLPLSFPWVGAESSLVLQDGTGRGTCFSAFIAFVFLLCGF